MASKATLSAKGYGEKKVWVEGFEYGTTISVNEAQSKFGSTVYPRETSRSGFDVSLVFTSYKEWNSFNDWISKYIEQLSTKDDLGMMVLMVPDANFARIGIPSRGVAFGDTSGQIIRRQVISFEGTSDPMAPGSDGSTSEPKIPDDWIAKQFFPTGSMGTGPVLSGTSYFQQLISKNREPTPYEIQQEYYQNNPDIWEYYVRR